jgi:hypothetical protein
MSVHYMALDVHCAFCEMAVMTRSGKLVLRDRCETRIPALREAIAKVRRPRRLTFEEGPLADWLARELRSTVDELVVCEPRRNSWIARDGDRLGEGLLQRGNSRLLLAAGLRGSYLLWISKIED